MGEGGRMEGRGGDGTGGGSGGEAAARDAAIHELASGIRVQCCLRILKGPNNISSKAAKIVDFFHKDFGAHGVVASQTKVPYVKIRSSSPPSGVNCLAVIMLVWLKGANTRQLS